jgi:uncharacterized membrane protein
MSELLSEWSALPNLHPALVHFPIALAVVALIIDGLSLLLRRRKEWGSVTALFYVLAALGSVGAYLSGREAAGSVGQLSAGAEAALAEHADLGLLTMIALCVAAPLRVVAAFWDNRRVAAAASWMAILVMAVATGLVVDTADHGGALVYRHGVAVQTSPAGEAARETEPTPTPGPARQTLVRDDDGSLHWRPADGHGASIDTVLVPAAGAPAEALKLSAPESADHDGAWIEVSGSTVACLPGVFGDVVVTATVDLSRFDGVFGLGHHIRSVDEGVYFTVGSDGHAQLIRRGAGEASVLDKGTVPPLGGLVTLRTSVAGRHLKGWVGDTQVVHGHGSSGDRGAVGLLLDGRGEVRLVEVSVEPALEH